MNPADVAVAWMFLVSLFSLAVILRSLWRWSAQKVSDLFDGAATDID